MGLHATEAIRDETGYTGMGVHTASRIGSIAAAGEILPASRRWPTPPTRGVSERRSVSLKGIVEPVDVVSIDWRDLREGLTLFERLRDAMSR